MSYPGINMTLTGDDVAVIGGMVTAATVYLHLYVGAKITNAKNSVLEKVREEFASKETTFAKIDSAGNKIAHMETRTNAVEHRIVDVEKRLIPLEILDGRKRRSVGTEGGI